MLDTILYWGRRATTTRGNSAAAAHAASGSDPQRLQRTPSQELLVACIRKLARNPRSAEARARVHRTIATLVTQDEGIFAQIDRYLDVVAGTSGASTRARHTVATELGQAASDVCAPYRRALRVAQALYSYPQALGIAPEQVPPVPPSQVHAGSCAWRRLGQTSFVKERLALALTAELAPGTLGALWGVLVAPGSVDMVTLMHRALALPQEIVRRRWLPREGQDATPLTQDEAALEARLLRILDEIAPQFACKRASLFDSCGTALVLPLRRALYEGLTGLFPASALNALEAFVHSPSGSEYVRRASRVAALLLSRCRGAEASGWMVQSAPHRLPSDDLAPLQGAMLGFSERLEQGCSNGQKARFWGGFAAALHQGAEYAKGDRRDPQKGATEHRMPTLDAGGAERMGAQVCVSKQARGR